jgi:hypothetical protein
MTVPFAASKLHSRLPEAPNMVIFERTRPGNAPVGWGSFVMDSVYERRVWSGRSSWPSRDRSAGRFVSDEWHETERVLSHS